MFSVKYLIAVKINQQKHFTIAKTAQKQSKQHLQMLLDINQFNGSIARKPQKRPRRDTRLNEVNWSLVVTLLLGNSEYQTNRNITKVRLHSASDPRKSHIRCKSDRFINLAFARNYAALSITQLYGLFFFVHCSDKINNITPYLSFGFCYKALVRLFKSLF